MENELLAKGAFEPATGGSSFYSNVFMAPKYTGGLGAILNPKQFNSYMHILVLRFLLSDRYGNLFSMGVVPFLLISRLLIYLFLLLSAIIFLLYFLWQKTLSVEGVAMATAPRVLTSITKPISFLC